MATYPLGTLPKVTPLETAIDEGTGHIQETLMDLPYIATMLRFMPSYMLYLWHSLWS